MITVGLHPMHVFVVDDDLACDRPGPRGACRLSTIPSLM